MKELEEKCDQLTSQCAADKANQQAEFSTAILALRSELDEANSVREQLEEMLCAEKESRLQQVCV